jgi:hypothetical protein
LTDSSALRESVSPYVTVEDVLGARTADFVDQAYGNEVFFIYMFQNEP